MTRRLRAWQIVALAATLWSPALAAPSGEIACGETQARTLGSRPDELLVYALPGEVLSVTVVPDPRAKPFTPRWRLLDVIGQAVPLATGKRRCSGRCETTPLPLGGVFVLRVTDPGLGEGPYVVSLEAVSATAFGGDNGPPTPVCARLVDGAPDGTRPLPADAEVAGTIDLPGETDTFTLVAERGDVVRVALRATQAGERFAPRWTAFDAAGARLPLAGGGSACPGSCETAPLTLGGVVTVLVADEGDDAVGAYALGGGRGLPTTTTSERPATSTSSTSSTTTTATDRSTSTSTTTSRATTTLAATTTTVATTTTLAPATTTTSRGSTSTTRPPASYDLSATIFAPLPPGAPAPRLGAAIAATGGRLLLGAPHAEATLDVTIVLDAGGVLVVDVGGAPPALGFGRVVRNVVEPVPGREHAFGAAVAALGDGMIVGAPGAEAAYFFPSVDEGAGVTLRPAALPTGARFGASVAAWTDVLAVGAPGIGRVYLFDPVTGAALGTLEPPAGTVFGDGFGTALAAADGRIAVGAPGTATRPGRVHVFEAATGRLVASLAREVPQGGDAFGASVAFFGDDVVVGAPGAGVAARFDGLSGGLVLSYAGEGGAPGDGFGAAVAVDDTVLFVGAPGDAGGAVYRFVAETGALDGVLRKATPAAGDDFGAALAAGGSRVFVGIPGDDSGSTEAGATHLYDGAAFVASFRQRLPLRAFGAAVAVTDDTLVVGAPEAEDGRGAAARIAPASATVQASIESPSDGMTRFGAAVGVLGSELLIGAPLEDGPAGASVGAVHVVDRDGVPVRAIANPRPGAGDQFGFAIDAVGADVYVGAPSAGELDIGAVYRLDGATGALRVTYGKPVPASGDFFGAAVAADGDAVLVGAPQDASSGVQSGAAYLFQSDTAELVAAVQNPAGGERDLFGAAVALGETVLVVGAPSAAAEAGRAYVVDRATGAIMQTLASPSPAAGDHFGASLALVGDLVFVGTPFDDDGAVETGAVYGFDVATGALVETIRNPPQTPFDHFGAALASGAAGLIVGSPGPSRVYLFDRVGTQSVAAPVRLLARGAAVATGCGNGLVEPGEECDDGNGVDLDDCRDDCTRGPCCAVDLLPSCDDGDRCTLDVRDAEGSCQHPPSGLAGCCESDADCPGGQCRVCVGCFLFKWDCCDKPSRCIPSNPECAGETCLDAAYCQCGGKLACSTEAVPVGVQTLFASACDFLRLQVSIAPDGTETTQSELVLARARSRTARKTLRKAARAARRLVAAGDLSRGCRREVAQQVKVVKRAIPRKRQLRRCVVPGA